MIKNLLEVIIIIGVGIFVFGIDQVFTVKFGDKWYPGMSSSWWKLSDDVSSKIAFYGFCIIVIGFGLTKIFNIHLW